MITETFDNQSPAIINPQLKEDAPQVDACILTFSHEIEKFVLENYDCKKIASIWFATGETPIYQIDHKGKTFAFCKTYVGAPACVGSVEDTLAEIKTDKYVVFGGAGCLNKEISHGKVMIPTHAYRDEGTSYHYAPAADYVTVRNADIVTAFMEKNGIPHVKGKTWTTDAFYRETVNNFEKHKADGCISVEMECAALQAMCDFKGLDFYTFFTGGDLLDAPEWDSRKKEGQMSCTQHDTGHFDIALELARYVVGD
ncbi:MAG: nucleoside phosphorylase [Roseburia sp.]|nr:nucleoside phosphorylase [Roseburia sp.]